MFHAVYENGARDTKILFEEIYKSEHILFYAKSHMGTSYKYYHLLNSDGEISPLILKECKLHGILQRDNNGKYSLEFDIEIPGKGVERVEMYRQEDFRFPPLYVAASIICTMR